MREFRSRNSCFSRLGSFSRRVGVKEVYFYATCLVDLFFPDAGMAGIELLEAAGVRVIFPKGQTCCGQPAFNCGYWEEARDVARTQGAPFPQDISGILA